MVTPAELLEPARLALREGDLAIAAAAIDDIARAHPDSPEPLKVRAELLEREGRHGELLTLTDDAAARFPTHQWWKQIRGETLVALGRTDEAEAFYQELLLEDSNSMAALKGLMYLAFDGERWDDCAKWAALGRSTHPDHRWWRHTGGQALELAGRTADAEHWLEDVLDRDPADAGAHSSLLSLAAQRKAWKDVLTRCSDLLQNAEPVPDSAFSYLILLALNGELIDDVRAELTRSIESRPSIAPRCLETLLTIENHLGRHETAVQLASTYSSVSSERIDLAVAYAYMGSVNHDAAEDLFSRLSGSNEADAAIARALMRSSELRIDEAIDIIRQARADFPHDERVWRTAFYLLQVGSRFDEAEQWLETRRQQEGYTPRLRLEEAGLHRSRMDFDVANELLDELIDGDRVDEATRRAALLVRADTARRSQAEPVRLAEVRQLLEEDSRRGANGDYVLIRSHIALGEHEQAAALIKAIPHKVDTWDAHVFRSWLAVEWGDLTRAKQHGERMLARRYYPQVHSKITNLEQRTEAPVRPDGIVAFVACRDEERRLPDFLRHHRELGVDAFFIIDNNSTDRTSEYLASQDDVALFHTTDDYVQSGLGMRWINELISGLNDTHWCLFADVDELLVYPGCETTSLHQFTETLDRGGFEGAGGYMLDMHGETLNASIDFRAGDSMLGASPYFTNLYDFQDFHLSPYVDVRGGFRSETLGIRNLQMTKTPLIRSDSGIKFLSSSHETTPGAIAKVATLFLHFKYIGDAMARAEQEANWTPYMYYGNNTEKLRRLSRGDDMRLLTDHALRYVSSEQLVSLGLLRPLSSPYLSTNQGNHP